MSILSSFKRRMEQSLAAVEEKKKNKKEQPKSEPIHIEPYKPVEIPHIKRTIHLIDADGNEGDLPEDAVLQDDMCIIPVDGHYYHQYVGCNYKGYGRLKLIRVEEAKKLGYMPCMACEDKIREITGCKWLDELEHDGDQEDDDE